MVEKVDQLFFCLFWGYTQWYSGLSPGYILSDHSRQVRRTVCGARGRAQSSFTQSLYSSPVSLLYSPRAQGKLK